MTVYKVSNHQNIAKFQSKYNVKFNQMFYSSISKLEPYVVISYYISISVCYWVRPLHTKKCTRTHIFYMRYGPWHCTGKLNTGCCWAQVSRYESRTATQNYAKLDFFFLSALHKLITVISIGFVTNFATSFKWKIIQFK